jgi:hypothetical protein
MLRLLSCGRLKDFGVALSDEKRGQWHTGNGNRHANHSLTILTPTNWGCQGWLVQGSKIYATEACGTVALANEI